MKIVFASTNKGKIKEIKELMAGLDVELLSLSDIDFTDSIDETGTTFEENARIKAEAVAKFRGLPAFADDSGIEIDAFDKAPGVYSSRYLGENTPYQQKNEIILKRLCNVPKEGRTARYVCCVCCIINGESFTVRGECEGYIGSAQCGSGGFGYDPIFMVGEKSMAEMTDQEKNDISHRGIAMRKFIEILSLKI